MEIHVIKPTKEVAKKLRVCAYCRVSTEAEEQENSLENQIEHYKRMIQNNPDYKFVNVYYDFGISGFKEKRPGFQQMLQDARDGKIDLIITKSVSRFARNTYTVLNAARELKQNGIGIFFELQNINTLTESGELMLTVLSAFAQAESENYSYLSKLGIQRKYEKGEPIRRLERSFGYTKDEYGEYILEPEEAKWVKKMYEMVADDIPVADVTRFLIENKVKTKKGADFCDSTVFRIIESEIYKGDFIMHKFYVNADRKIVRNRGEVDAWYIEDDHVPIVSHKLWQRAQEAIARKREYLAQSSMVRENTEENYPYKNHVFCEKCGYPLIRRVYSNGNRVNWGCGGQKRYNSDFCTGINVPDSVLREWGDFEGNIYIRECEDSKGRKIFRYSSEVAWQRRHRVKSHKANVPELNEENYPFYRHIFCKECGSRLVRYYSGNGKVFWICNGSKRKGVDYCKGIRISDEDMRALNIGKEDVLIERKGEKNGKKCYSYTSKTGRA